MKRTRGDDASSDVDFRGAPSSRTESHTGDSVGSAPDRHACYATQIQAINTALYAWMSEEFASATDKSLDYSQGVQDAIDYIRSISSRYLSKPGSTLTFGSGDCGQAGHGMDEDADLMVPYPRPVNALNSRRVVFVACGGLHNAVTTENGQVYTWGCSDDGSLGRGGEEGTPLLVAGDDNIMLKHHFISAACGDGQTIVLSSTGELWGWGCYKDKEGKQWFDVPAGVSVGTAALKAIKRKQVDPMVLPFFSRSSHTNTAAPVLEIACGASYNLARCQDGKVYSWGAAECGELARKSRPMKVPDPDGEEGDEIYDHNAVLHDYLTPGPMYHVLSAAAAAAGKMDGDILVDGVKLREVKHVKGFGCGSFHALCIINTHTYATGLNNYGQLGLGDTDNRPYFTEITELTNAGVVAVKGGVHHSLSLTSAGKLLAFGRGDSGQLGVPTVAENAGGFVDVPIAPGTGNAKCLAELSTYRFTGIACGNNHCLAIATSDTDMMGRSTAEAEPVLYSWGYGDMLALGHGVEKDETAPRRVLFGNKAKNPTRISAITCIDAGGQHSALVAQAL